MVCAMMALNGTNSVRNRRRIMNTFENPSADETVVQSVPDPQPKAEKPRSWEQELRRRSRRLRQLLEQEEANPSTSEPWRLKLIQRALFSTWLDERGAKRARRTPRKAA